MTRSPIPRTFAVIGALALLTLATGCGYRAGGPYRTDVHSVYVDMVGSREFRRNIEFDLTEALKKRLGAQGTPYKLAPREKADSILQVEILEERQTELAPDFRTRQPREKTLTFAVRVQWKDLRTGRMLAEQPILLESADYLPPIGESERFAQQKTIDRLAARILALMYEDF